jgi:hypothetical protein
MDGRALVTKNHGTHPRYPFLHNCAMGAFDPKDGYHQQGLPEALQPAT